MDKDSPSEWLDKHIWPEIHIMLLHDAYFWLMARARELSGEFNGSVAWLIETGYINFQTVAIRRLCDDRRDVISLRRLFREASKNNLISQVQMNELLKKLDSCEPICNMVNNHLAHKANPYKSPNVEKWDLKASSLAGAQKTICEVVITFERDFLHRTNRCPFPEPQYDFMSDFRHLVPEEKVQMLWDFWHENKKRINSWIPSSVTNVQVTA